METYERQCQSCGLVFDVYEDVPQEGFLCNLCRKRLEDQRKAEKRHRKCLKNLERRKQYYA